MAKAGNLLPGGSLKPAFLRIAAVKRQGLVAAGLIGSAASVCVLLNQHLHLGAAEDGKKSFREALKGAPEPQLVGALGAALFARDARDP